jgi:hypothetical protein
VITSREIRKDDADLHTMVVAGLLGMVDSYETAEVRQEFDPEIHQPEIDRCIADHRSRYEARFGPLPSPEEIAAAAERARVEQEPLVTVVQTGTATIRRVRGRIPDVSRGATCAFTQMNVGGVRCRWEVTCNGVALYGVDGEHGFAPCSDPSWPGGTAVVDSAMTGEDGDPAITIHDDRITVRDDARGSFGAFEVTATIVRGD